MTATTMNFSRLSSTRSRAAGIDALIVHARAAMLGGLSPKQNREIPPLKYEHVHRLKRERPDLTVILNGGLCDQRGDLRTPGARGSTAPCSGGRPIIGRRCSPNWSRPCSTRRGPCRSPGRSSSAWCLTPKRCAQRGIRLHSITRHMHGVMAGREGARAWRRFLSEVAARPEAVPETLFSALPIIKQGIAA